MRTFHFKSMHNKIGVVLGVVMLAAAGVVAYQQTGMDFPALRGEVYGESDSSSSPVCSTDADCPIAMSCVLTTGGGGICTPTPCNTDADCGQDLVCVLTTSGGVCATRSCMNDSECEAGQVCVLRENGTGMCYTPASSEQSSESDIVCRTSADCAAGETCVATADGRGYCYMPSQSSAFSEDAGGAAINTGNSSSLTSAGF
jgi:hypothetical protein